jgi:hypothetical protein
VTSTDLARRTAVAPALAPETVLTATGMRLSVSAARRFTDSVPPSSRDARAFRWREFQHWCTATGFETGDRGSLASFLAAYADQGHPVGVLRAFSGTLQALLAIGSAPRDQEERTVIAGILRDAERKEARRGGGLQPGPLQADAVGPEDLLQMVRKLDRTTARGARDILTLLIDWWMAGRCSEPASLELDGAVAITAEVPDDDGVVTAVPALRITLPYSKTDQSGAGTTILILSPLDAPELCPVRALADWHAVLAAAGQMVPGPLLRRIDRHGQIGADAAGRRTIEPSRQGGITARTVRNIITAAARAAKLIDPQHEDAVAEIWSARAETAAQAQAAASEPEANALWAAWRLRLRAARQRMRRITGHSMRRGFIQTALLKRIPAEDVARHSRHAPGSRSFWTYARLAPDWRTNVTGRLHLSMAA